MKKLLLLLSITFSIKLFAQPAPWLYNQMITVNNPNAQNAVNYQLKITVNTQSLITAGKMMATGSDIRFAGACASSVFFNYWIEAGINTPTTAIWVKIPMIAANTSSIIFMFFGNSAATAASSIPGTFRGPNSATDSVTGGTSGGLLVCQRGFRFTPLQNLLVTDFGKNEPSGTTRYVTLFNYTSQAILSQTQVAGPAATYTYGPISSPLWLAQGTQYVLQIYGLASDGYYFGTSSQIGQHLTYGDMQYSNGGTQNTFPTNVLVNYHYGYGDFLYYITNTLTTIPSYTLSGALFNINASSNFVCTGGSVTMTTTASGSYTWSTGAVNVPVITVTPLTTTTYSVSEASPSGCNSTAVITITVNGTAPTLTVSASAPTVCPTNTVIINASGALVYSINGGVTNGVPFSPLVTTTYVVTGTNGCGSSTAAITITVTSLPVVAISSPTVVCAGNISNLTAAGATTYTWNPGNLTGANVVVSPQVSTTYTVVGTTTPCAGIYTVAVAANPNPTLGTSATLTMTCAGKNVTITATGANGYTWQPSGQIGSSIVVAPTIPTSYLVTGTNAFGCSSSTNQVIVTLPSPTLIATVSNTTICLGASVTLYCAGADTFSWSTGSTNSVVVDAPTTTTTYTVVGTNTLSGCSDSKMLTVTVFVATIAVTAPTAICMGSSVTLNASGANTYTWNTTDQTSNITVSPNITTTYTVYGTSTFGSMSCASNGITTVTVNPLPVVTTTTSRSNICKNESTTLYGNGALNYLWSTNANTNSIVVAPLILTVYTVTGTDANNCSATATIQVKVSNCTGLTETSLNSEAYVKVVPNPNNGTFSVKAKKQMVLELVNELGQVVQLLNFAPENNYMVKVEGLSKGIYFVRSMDKEQISVQKIIVGD